jgi:hypothetical protein
MGDLRIVERISLTEFSSSDVLSAEALERWEPGSAYPTCDLCGGRVEIGIRGGGSAIPCRTPRPNAVRTFFRMASRDISLRENLRCSSRLMHEI